MSVLEPTAQDVQSLEDTPLRDLVRRLCEAELRAAGLSTAGLIASGHQDAKDGGVDVLVEGAAPATGHLHRLPIGFQAKAKPMGARAIASEMRPKGQLRPSLVDLGLKGGAYIIACGRESVTGQAREGRIAAMASAFADCATPAPHFDFYDAGRLADWAREHRGVAIWLMGAAGRPTRGWSALSNWSAADQGLAPAYLVDDAARLSVGADAEPVAVVEGVNALRDALRRPNAVVRLLGQSGMGKTRLVQALFDDRLGDAALAAHLAVYGDAGEKDMEVTPLSMARQMIEARDASILIVDNCSAALHAQLVELTTTAEAQFTLLTIDFDIGLDRPEKTIVARLDRAGDDLIERLLEQRMPHLSSADRRRVAEFSEGNTRIALALASTAATSGSLATLDAKALLDRLFLTDRREPDPTLRHVARIASLAYAFFVDGQDDAAELTVLAGLTGVSEAVFLDKIGDLLERGLAQQRGRQRAILPQALAIYLAKEAVGRLQRSRLQQAFTTAPIRLRTSFARRLGFLHDSVEAGAIAHELLAPGSSLANLAREDEIAANMLGFLAPLAPRRVLGILQDYVARFGAEQTTIYTNQIARQITALLGKLTYEPDLFDDAARLMARLVASQDERRMIDHLRPKFTPLFQIAWSGTMATPKQRFKLIEGLLQAEDAAERDLGLQALRSALQARPNAHAQVEAFGAHCRTTGWRPKDDLQIEQWFKCALDLCLGAATRLDGPSARTLLATAYAGLVRIASVTDLTVAAMRQVAGSGFWAEGWFAACGVLNQYKGDRQSAAMRECEAALRPKTLQDRFDAFTRQRLWDWHDPDGDDAVSSYEDARRRARQVGADAFAAGEAGEALIRTALSDPTVAAMEFGAGLASAATDFDADWEALIARARSLPRDTLNASAIVGFLETAKQRAPSLAEAWLQRGSDDPLLASLMPWLEASTGAVGPTGMKRIVRALASGAVAPEVAQALVYLRMSAEVTADDLADLAHALLDQGQAWMAVRLIEPKRPPLDTEPWPKSVKAAVRRILTEAAFADDGGLSPDYQMSALADRVLPGPDGRPVAARLLEKVLQRLQDKDDDFWTRGMPGLLGLIARDHPTLLLDVCLAQTSEHLRYKVRHLLKGYDDDDGGGGNVLAGVSDDVVLSWVAQDSASRGPQMAELIPYFQPGAGTDFAWTPKARRLLDLTEGHPDVTEAFEMRFGSGASSGDHSFRYSRRLAMLRDLGGSACPEVRAWGASFHDRLTGYLAELESQRRSAEPRFE